MVWGFLSLSSLLAPPEPFSSLDYADSGVSMILAPFLESMIFSHPKFSNFQSHPYHLHSLAAFSPAIGSYVSLTVSPHTPSRCPPPWLHWEDQRRHELWTSSISSLLSLFNTSTSSLAPPGPCIQEEKAETDSWALDTKLLAFSPLHPINLSFAS